MLREVKSKTINGTEYKVTQLGAITGSKVFLRLLKVLGPLVTSKNMGALFESIKEEDYFYLCDSFSPCTIVRSTMNGKPFEGTLDKVFDLHFAGRYGELFEWLEFCVDTNFSEVLKKGEGLGLLASKATEPGSTGQTVQTGQSGASS